MKKFSGILLFFIWVGTGIVFANTPPEVKQVTASQRTDGSKVVDIRYNLTDADNNTCTITLQVSSDGGTTWAVQAVTFLPNSAIGLGIRPGNGKVILWDAGKDLPGVFGSNYRVKVIADDGYNPIPANMVVIPAGTFQMGNSKDASEGSPEELPVHTVTLDSFAIGKYEITNGQFCAFLKSAYPSQLKVVNGTVYASSDSVNGYPYCDTSTSSSCSQIVYSNNTFTVRTKNGRDMTNDPMVQVSWYGAVAYCDWRSQQEGKQLCYDLSTWNCDFSKKGYRLPTEAEWEYAARGGLSGKRFPWGDTINQTQANFYSSSYDSYNVSPVKKQYHPLWNDGIDPYTSPVGFFDGTLKYKTNYNWSGSSTSYQTASGANAYGLYDMAGNVWEWCHDWYGSYSSSSQTNPTGPITGNWCRILRGGWLDQISSAYRCRVSYRDYGFPPDYRGDKDFNYGFRLVLDY